MTDIEKQINLVVEVRRQLKDALEERHDSFSAWEEANAVILDNESNARTSCQEAEAQLRDMAISVFSEAGDKQVAPGVGIKEVTKLSYELGIAFEWAKEHKLALKLDVTAFEKIVKASPDQFANFSINITKEPQATIATELQVIE